MKLLLRDFCMEQSPFTLELKDFGCFAPRVIFVEVVPHPDLRALQMDLASILKTKMNIFNANYQNRPFRPHVTVAFRDLRKGKFFEAWDYFKAHSFQEKTTINSLSLLIHQEGRWQMEAPYPLGQIEIN